MSGHETDQNYILNLPLTGESVQSTEPARLSELSIRREDPHYSWKGVCRAEGEYP